MFPPNTPPTSVVRPAAPTMPLGCRLIIKLSAPPTIPRPLSPAPPPPLPRRPLSITPAGSCSEAFARFNWPLVRKLRCRKQIGIITLQSGVRVGASLARSLTCSPPLLFFGKGAAKKKTPIKTGKESG